MSRERVNWERRAGLTVFAKARRDRCTAGVGCIGLSSLVYTRFLSILPLVFLVVVCFCLLAFKQAGTTDGNQRRLLQVEEQGALEVPPTNEVCGERMGVCNRGVVLGDWMSRLELLDCLPSRKYFLVVLTY